MYSKGVVLGCLAVVCVMAAPKAEAASNAIVETVVRQYFKDTPVMIEIARCESEFRHYGADGTVLKGGWGGKMLGVYQFFGSIHSATALAMGYDLSTLPGNLAYAKHLYNESGTTPWNSSKSCWNTAANTSSDQAKRAALIALITQLQQQIARMQAKQS